MRADPIEKCAKIFEDQGFFEEANQYRSEMYRRRARRAALHPVPWWKRLLARWRAVK